MAPSVASVPTPDAAFARPALPVNSQEPPPSSGGAEAKARAPSAELAQPPRAERRSGVGFLLLAAAGLTIGVLGYRMMHRADHGAPDLAALPVPPVVSLPPAPSALSPAGADTATAHEPAASATAADFPVAPAAPAASASAVPASAGVGEPPVPGSLQVTITTVPPKAKFFHFGKEVGTSPFVIDLPPGEKRAYEVWLPGHITRKVLVDGSKSEMTLGLREEPQ
jgi:hypothetical protein